MINFSKIKKYPLVVLALAGLVFCFWKISQKGTGKTSILIEEKNAIFNQENNLAQNSKNEKTKEPTNNNLPSKIFIKIPFTTQAPYADWDEIHEEACEEASLIMIKYYLDNKILDKKTAEEEIQALVKFQIEKYGDYRDSTAEEMVQLASDYYGIKNLEVIYDFSPQDIKKYLASGKPIIALAAGRLLNNPNFTYPGPLYHVILLVGYNGDTIITNDPGTRKGEGYKYSLGALYYTMHDFPGRKEDIEKGRKAMIVIN